MGRTGIASGGGCVRPLPNHQRVASPGTRWDSRLRRTHVRDSDRDQAPRRSAAPGLAMVHQFRDRLLSNPGLPVPRLVLGGTPTFPIHAEVMTEGTECSPGTCVLHDAGYADKFPDLPFTPAALLLLTRVISQPTLEPAHARPGTQGGGRRPGRFTAHPPGSGRCHPWRPERGTPRRRHPRGRLVPPGTPMLAIPTHVCPTCALHAWAYVVEDGDVVALWDVAARQRVIKV